MDVHSLFGLGLVDCKSYICVPYFFAYCVAFASYYLFLVELVICLSPRPVWKHEYYLSELALSMCVCVKTSKLVTFGCTFNSL